MKSAPGTRITYRNLEAFIGYYSVIAESPDSEIISLSSSGSSVTSPMTSDPSRPLSTALPRHDITSSRLHMRRQIDSAQHIQELIRIICKLPWAPVIEDSVLIVQTQEQPHTDGLQPEDHEEEPDRREQQLTHHPETWGEHHHLHHHHHYYHHGKSPKITKSQNYDKKSKLWQKSQNYERHTKLKSWYEKVQKMTVKIMKKSQNFDGYTKLKLWYQKVQNWQKVKIMAKSQMCNVKNNILMCVCEVRVESLSPALQQIQSCWAKPLQLWLLSPHHCQFPPHGRGFQRSARMLQFYCISVQLSTTFISSGPVGSTAHLSVQLCATLDWF